MAQTVICLVVQVSEVAGKLIYREKRREIDQCSRYARIEVGDPPQTLEVDVDMLSPDFYTIMTTSERGSKYDTFGSSAHGKYLVPASLAS